MKILKFISVLIILVLLAGCGGGAGGSLTPPKTDFYDDNPDFYPRTLKAIESMTLEEQVAQLFFVRFPGPRTAKSEIADVGVGGYILFGGDFSGKTPEEITHMLSELQQVSKVGLLFGVDEEGGDVVRVSFFSAFRATRFPSPQQLYRRGGFETIKADTVEKNELLKALGLNVNLAPVADISRNRGDYIYYRTVGLDAEGTCEFVTTVVEQMKQDRMGSVVKHFPGYGGSSDTHFGVAYDNRPFSAFESSDLRPFAAAIEAGVDSVLVSHNIVGCIDPDYPASLSKPMHRLLREEMGFEGVIMTDDLVMGAIKRFTGSSNAAVTAILAGNDMLISSEFEVQYAAVLEAVKNGDISEEQIYESCLRVLKWKEALGLL